MAKYRGSDGWIHDDSVEGTRRYENKEKVSDSEKAEDAPVEGKPLNECPNCALSISWRRMEGYCVNCGWGTPEGVRPKTENMSDGEAGACCGFFAALVLFPLVGAGVGYGFWGFGGFLAGGGLGAAIPIGIVVLGLLSIKGKKRPPE